MPLFCGLGTHIQGLICLWQCSAALPDTTCTAVLHTMHWQQSALDGPPATMWPIISVTVTKHLSECTMCCKSQWASNAPCASATHNSLTGRGPWAMSLVRVYLSLNDCTMCCTISAGWPTTRLPKLSDRQCTSSHQQPTAACLLAMSLIIKKVYLSLNDCTMCCSISFFSSLY